VLIFSDICLDDVLQFDSLGLYAELLCPLRTLECSGSWIHGEIIMFTEKMLRSILTCFASSLERLTVQSVDISQEALQILQKEYRFKTIISVNKVIADI